MSTGIVSVVEEPTVGLPILESAVVGLVCGSSAFFSAGTRSMPSLSRRIAIGCCGACTAAACMHCHAAQPSASEARVQERSLAFLLAFTRYLSTLVLAINSTSAVGTAVGTYFF